MQPTTPTPKTAQQRKPKDRTRILRRNRKILERLNVLMRSNSEKPMFEIMDMLADEFCLSVSNTYKIIRETPRSATPET